MRVFAVSVALGALILFLGAPAFTANNIVPATNAGTSSTPITADTLKPSACSGITLTNLVRVEGIRTDRIRISSLRLAENYQGAVLLGDSLT